MAGMMPQGQPDPRMLEMLQQQGQGPAPTQATDQPTPGDNVDNPQQPDAQMLQEQQAQQGQPQAPQQQAPPNPIQVVTQLLIQVASTPMQSSLNVDIQTKAILTLAQALKTLIDAQTPQQATGPDPQVLTQIEVQKAQHDMKLKEVELQTNIQLKQAELQMKVQMTQAKIEQSRQDAQVKQAQASHDAQLKQQEQATKQAVTAQNAQIQAAQAEQQMQQADQTHKKAMAAPTPKPGGKK